MTSIDQLLVNFRDLVWGWPLLILLFLTGVILTVMLRGLQIKYAGFALKQLFRRGEEHHEGDITHVEALMTSLAGAIGTGSIVGVATAITLGGLGAIFWMWVTALLGMATKYAESLLAVHYRRTGESGEIIGGPMYYIEEGLGLKWLAVLFAFFAAIAAIGTGNLVQINSIAEAVQGAWGGPEWLSGIVICAITGMVLIGGVKSIGRMASYLVPIMGLIYIGGGALVLALYFQKIPGAIGLILQGAFQPQAAFGGFAGASVLYAIRMGVARSVFSNEAGMGISSIAQAAAKTDNPARQAMISMCGALFSTLIVCTTTALVIAVTGSYGLTDESGKMLSGATLAMRAFQTGIPFGHQVVTIGLILFAFSTIVAWAYYGEKCAQYLLGDRVVPYYRVLYTLSIVPGAMLKMELVWLVADITNGLMVLPNLIALLLLSKVVVTETKKFLKFEDQQRLEQV
ncbi:MAG: sodium:alanine symporter family protein [Chlamydiia bacterium]|nr:sodium:alanine symporter family protein [Chlamydiia bacterium]